MEEDFVKFMDHFIVDSLTYYGDLTDDFKNTIESFGMKTIYSTDIAGFSK